MSNAILARQLRDQAGALTQRSDRRAALMTASVALCTTGTTKAALRALGELRPGDIRDQAIGLIETLTRKESS